MATKYSEEIKAKCVEAVKNGKALTEITKEFGPNPKAIGRYCEAAGVVIPKKERKPKAEKKEKSSDKVKAEVDKLADNVASDDFVKNL